MFSPSAAVDCSVYISVHVLLPLWRSLLSTNSRFQAREAWIFARFHFWSSVFIRSSHTSARSRASTASIDTTLKQACKETEQKKRWLIERGKKPFSRLFHCRARNARLLKLNEVKISNWMINCATSKALNCPLNFNSTRLRNTSIGIVK